VDSVKLVGNATSQSPDVPWSLFERPEKIQLSVKGWYELAKNYFEQPDASYSSSMPWQETFWRAISGDEILDLTRPVTPQDVHLFEDFHNSEDLDTAHPSEVYASLNMNVIEQCFFITEQGYMGTGPPTIKAGDEVWVLCGENVPFILRPLELATHHSGRIGSVPSTDGSYRHQLLGDGFVYGIMQGQAIRAHDTEMMQVNLA
jgi:hypothetical protein